MYDAAGSCSTLKARAILDGGRQRTYVASRIQKMLLLPTFHTETVSFKTFGSKGGTRQPCNAVISGIVTKDGKPLVISALVVPHICDAICFQPITAAKKCYSHPAKLDLADSAGARDDLSINICSWDLTITGL